MLLIIIYYLLFIHYSFRYVEDISLCGGVAQLGEHLPCKQGVRSSILLISTTDIANEV